LGFSYNTGTKSCKGYNGVLPTEDGGADENDTTCYKRESPALGKAYYDKAEVSKTGITLYDTWAKDSGSDMVAFFLLVKAEDEAYRPYYIQKTVNTKESTQYTGTLLVTTTAKSDIYDKVSTGKKQLYEAEVAKVATAKSQWTAAKAISDKDKTTKEDAEKAYDTAVVQQTLQGQIEELAKAAKAKVDADVLTLKGLATTAAGAKTTADTAATASSGALTKAETDYTEKAAKIKDLTTASKTPLGELVTLRGAAATAWTGLDTATGNLVAKNAAITTAQAALKVAEVAQAAAVLKCKES